MSKYVYMLLFLIGTTSSWAQTKKKVRFLEEELPVRSELFVGGGINTRGFQVNLGYSLIKSPFRTLSFFADFGEVKDAKERQQIYNGLSLRGGAPKAFTYGKKNNLFFSRVGCGEKYYLSVRSRRLISLGFTYAGGFTLGMVRPYYLDLIYRDNGGRPEIISEKYNESNLLKFLNQQEVYGPSGAAYGWDELNLVPGVFFKAGLLIDWGAFDNVLKDIEIGIAADFYFGQIPIMIFEKNTPVFVNLYVTVHLGHRW